MKLSEVIAKRRLIERAAQGLTDEEALDGAELFPEWRSATVYTLGQRVRYGGVLYRCLQTHTSQAGWNPVDAPSLWARVLIEDPNVIPEWEQPDSTNPYAKGDKVTHNGKTWESTCDGNVWEPGVYGWIMV